MPRIIACLALWLVLLAPMAAVADEIAVDLNEPSYSEGVLFTDKGGIVHTSEFWLQAQQIRFVQNSDGEKRVEAWGKILLQYHDQAFIADRVEYDFRTRCGRLFHARSLFERWYTACSLIELNEDGSYCLYDAYLTTCEELGADWQVKAKTISVSPCHLLCAKNTLFRFLGLPILWLPTYTTDLSNRTGTPLKWNLQWGGKLGPRLSLRYKAYTWQDWKVYLRLAARFRFGAALGVETAHDTPERCFYTLNYWARDASAVEKDLKWRYLFKGTFHQDLAPDCTTLDFKYAKFSDVDMETDYYDRDFEFRNAGRTEALLRSQSHDWIANLATRVRINSFQTINEQLPLLDFHLRPFEVGHTGIYSFNRLKAGYLQYSYADHIQNVQDFNSIRLQAEHTLSRPIQYACLTIVPEAGFTGIYYSHTTVGKAQDVRVGRFSLEAFLEAYRMYGACRHVVRPYASYRLFAGPGSSVLDHPIFDIDDGWAHLQYATFGLRQDLFGKTDCGPVHLLQWDLYGHLFVDLPSVPRHFPLAYSSLSWRATPSLTVKSEGAWDLAHHHPANFNLRLLWTLDEDYAVATEYRHRGDHYWRKVDFSNYMMEASRTEEELLASTVSDKRDTWLFHIFCRLNPSWTLELQSRSGWGRLTEPSYLEYQLDLSTTLQCAWKVRVSYQHKEYDDRFSLYVALGDTPPTKRRYGLPPW